MRELDGRINQQGDQELKDSVTSISHDLRTLLTAICGYLNLLKHEEKTTQENYRQLCKQAK